MKKILKYLGYIVGSVAIIILTAAAIAYFYFSSSLPSYSGNIKLDGLQNPVSITRDEFALPHIKAQNSHDAYFAIGYAHAQDRLWQMQLHRHIAMGRLAELVGQNGLETDKFLRTLGMFEAAKASYHLLSDSTKTELEAYSAGINAYLDEGNVLPIEFTILQLEKPKPWQPIHSVAWMKIMAWDLNSTWRKELNRLVLSANFSPAQIADLHPPYPGDTPFISPDPEILYGFKLNASSNPSLSALNSRIKITKIIDNQTTQGIGSNNWVISGSLSETGKPLLANDPHLALTAPALWYHAHLQTADGKLNAIGSTMPGVPFIILGRNDKIAWGFTNTDPDAQDLYVEKITRAGFYKTPTGEAAFIRRNEVIKVKGRDDYKFTVRSTRHGPVISDRLADVAELLGKNHVLAMRWTALDNDSTTLDAAAGLAAAQNWPEFLAATRNFKAPEQSIVYADTAGNIGMIAPGAVPIRHPDNELYGQFPSPGWVAKYDWQGYIPFDELPRKFNPANGIIATANHKIIDDDYKHYIASKWTLPYRYDRIIDLLSNKPPHTLDSLQAIQLDQYSLFLQNMRPLLDTAINAANKLDQPSYEAYELLKQWDGNGTVDSAEMLIITLWIRNIQQALLTPEFNTVVKRNHQFLENIFADINGSSKWCGDINGDANNIANATTCAQLAADSLASTVNQLSDALGSDMSDWHWGDVHQAVGAHRIFDKVAGLNSLFNIVTPAGGGKMTVNVGTYGTTDSTDLNQIFRNTHGPSLRHLFDLADLENSRYIHSSGQSGNIFSPHYADYSKMWSAGGYIPMVMDEANYAANAIGTLNLLPKDQ